MPKYPNVLGWRYGFTICIACLVLVAVLWLLFMPLSVPGPEGWTAIFTCFLTISTVMLWHTTRQSVLIAARALDSFERPIIFPSVVSTNFDGYSSFAAFEADNMNARAEITFAFKNFGRVAAQVTDIRVALMFKDAPPALKAIVPKNSVIDLIIPPNEAFQLKAASEIVDHRSYKLPLWVFGTIRYRAILGDYTEREVEFLWEYTRDAPIQFGPSRRGDKQRNRNT